MNNEIENRAYPCDEPEARRSYPCDTNDEAFSYANDSSANTESAEPIKKGKGRRGGNAAASVVVHSGNFKVKNTETAEKKSFGDRKPYGDRENRHGDRFERRSDRDDRRNDRFERRSDRDDRRNDRFERRGDRDDRRNDRFEKRGDRFERRDNRDDRRGGKTFGSRRAPSPESLFSVSYLSRIVKTTEVGAFVEAPEEIKNSPYARKVAESGLILLPFAEQIGRPERGTDVKVYFYEDKGGRLAATMRAPILRDGEVGVLTVAAVTKIGAFLDNGVPKQVLLPFKEQLHSPQIGDEVLVYIYSDKSGRQAATMRVYSHLDKHSPYKEDDRVTGFVYEINEDLGIFVAVDNKYYGLVPIRETFKTYEYGDEIEARVSKIREDGKLDLLIRDKLYKTVQEDADVIMYELKRNNGFLPYGDRADAQFIEETYAMSKNQFKRALGHLYKNHVVELDREHDTVRLLKK